MRTLGVIENMSMQRSSDSRRSRSGIDFGIGVAVVLLSVVEDEVSSDTRFLKTRAR